MDKRRLGDIVPRAGGHLRAHLTQSAVVDGSGLGGAAATVHVRTAASVAADLQDQELSRPVARSLGAFAADSAAAGPAGPSEPPPGPLGAIDVVEGRQTAVAALEDVLAKRPR